MGVISGDWLIMFAYSCFGAALLWTRATALNRHFNSFSDVIALLTESERMRGILSFITFITMGGLVSMFFVGPLTVPHALAGGMAWSRLAARD
jgi:hypothetical protein